MLAGWFQFFFLFFFFRFVLFLSPDTFARNWKIAHSGDYTRASPSSCCCHETNPKAIKRLFRESIMTSKRKVNEMVVERECEKVKKIGTWKTPFFGLPETRNKKAALGTEMELDFGAGMDAPPIRCSRVIAKHLSLLDAVENQFVWEASFLCGPWRQMAVMRSGIHRSAELSIITNEYWVEQVD